jgi:hypothetical protein
MADFSWSTEHRLFCLPDRIADLAARPNRGPMSALGQKSHLTGAYLDEVPSPICGDASDTHATRYILSL